MNPRARSFVRSSLLAALVAITALGAVAGCSSCRVVRVTRTGGEVALQGLQDEAREKANRYMSARCPGGYEVLDEGEAVIGSETTAETRRGPTIFGIPSTHTAESTTDKREWRIRYQCRPDAANANATAPGSKARDEGRIQELVVRF